MEFLALLLVNGLVIGSIYALVALGFVLIYKSSDVLNLAQGELVMIGAYVCFFFVVQYNIPFFAAFILTLVFSTVMGLAIERAVLRPLIGQPIISVIMVTIGLSSVLRAVVFAIWGVDTRPFPPLLPQEPVMFGTVPITQVYIYSFGIAMLLLAIFTVFFKYSKTGIAMRAVADDQQAALSMGISVRRIFAMAWIIAAIVSSIGGILVGFINGINISLSYMGLKVLPVAILGGLDSIPGAVVGGLVIGVLENLSGGYLDPLVGGGVKEVAPFIFLVIVLMIKPYGLFGKEIIERV